MNPKSYRILTKLASSRLRCPVCREEVYSRAGIHPQCAVLQSDTLSVKNKGRVLSSQAEPVSVSVIPEQAGADAVVDLPAAMRIFDPDRTAV